MGFIDLHLHSTCSDGVLTPSQLVAAAHDTGLAAIALCDHDTVSGVAEAQHVAQDTGINVISGVELSVTFHGYDDIHLLGYGIETDNAELLSHLDAFALRRANRNREIVATINTKLEAQDKAPLAIEAVEALADGVIGRPHIGRALMARGYVKDMQQAFEQYLVPCNVPKHYWPLTDALATIRLAGGVAVLAHPTSITPDHRLLTDLISELHVLGLDGLEVYNNMATEGDMLFLQGLARRLKLMVTAGSDFHGTGPDEQIGKGRGGIRFSDALLPPLLELSAQRAVRHSPA